MLAKVHYCVFRIIDLCKCSYHFLPFSSIFLLSSSLFTSLSLSASGSLYLSYNFLCFFRASIPVSFSFLLISVFSLFSSLSLPVSGSLYRSKTFPVLLQASFPASLSSLSNSVIHLVYVFPCLFPLLFHCMFLYLTLLILNSLLVWLSLSFPLHSSLCLFPVSIYISMYHSHFLFVL